MNYKPLFCSFEEIHPKDEKQNLKTTRTTWNYKTTTTRSYIYTTILNI